MRTRRSKRRRQAKRVAMARRVSTPNTLPLEALDTPAATSQRLPYLPGIDGLRALAVLAVLVYHAEPGWLPGGFLGVEVFFVISGFLITSILLGRSQGEGRPQIGAFWLSRARRLLPAVVVMVGAVVSYALVALPHEVAGLRQDAAAAAGYATNWYLVFDHQSYFESFGRPSLLRHLWSLAVEEQFYIVWPLLLTAGLRFLPRRLLPLLILLGAGGSALLMAALYGQGVDHSRLYYGTDTRAAGLLLGSALAFVWRPGDTPITVDRRAVRWGVEAMGVVALGVLAWLHVTLDDNAPLLYLGGLAMVDVATAALIVVAAWPGARVGGLLGVAPLRWLGTRSYSVYLWHWPVFMLTRPGQDVPLDGLELLALRFAITVVLAELSYRLIETPARRGALGRAWSDLRGACAGRRWSWRVAAPAGALASVFALAVVLAGFVASAGAPEVPAYLAAGRVQAGPWQPANASAAPERPPPAGPTATPVPARTPPPTRAAPARPPPPALLVALGPTPVPTQRAPQPTATPLPSVSVGHATAIGDSVMLGAVDQLSGAVGGISIDAALDRQVSAGIDLLRFWKASGQLGDTVIVHLGTNGTFSADQFDEMMQVLSDRGLVVFINVRVPRDWEAQNNDVLADGVSRYPNARLVDWHAWSATRRDLFYDDATHVKPAGADLYAALIAAALR
ncbi:MAG: acyltransferase family protein [Dehalococcoidia bacterium]